MQSYVVATIKNWHINLFNQRSDSDFKGWHLIITPEVLTFEKLSLLKPKDIFFPHWSWIVPNEIIDNFECVCFHSSDVPYGRGGSPIQNLIIRGIKETKISALKMVKELDAGPVYLKKLLSLEGRGQAIYERSSFIIADMMKEIAEKEPIPEEQQGNTIVFKRRQGNDNILPTEQENALETLYDHIRMLDADFYPSSYIEHGAYRIDFSEASLKSNYLEAKVKITRKLWRKSQ
jgi:methionyl-tRNA formyltransferase